MLKLIAKQFVGANILRKADKYPLATGLLLAAGIIVLMHESVEGDAAPPKPDKPMGNTETIPNGTTITSEPVFDYMFDTGKWYSRRKNTSDWYDLSMNLSQQYYDAAVAKLVKIFNSKK